MKHSIVVLTALTAFLVAIAVSGCTGSSGGVTVTPAAAPTPTPAPAQGVATTSFFDSSQYIWYQYKITMSDTSSMSMVHTYQYSLETLDGVQARHANITEDMLPEMLVYLDIWSSPATGTTLKIHEKVYEGGKLTADRDLPAAGFPRYEVDDPASPKFSAASLTPAPSSSHYHGYINVTFANKTYKAVRYVGSSGDINYTYYIAKEVPLPLKFSVLDNGKGVGSTFELVQWGNATYTSSNAAKGDIPANLSYKIDVLGGNRTPATFTVADLRALASGNVSAYSCPDCREKGMAQVYSGVKVSGILAKTGIPPRAGNYTLNVTSTSGDVKTYSKAEAEKSLLAFRQGDTYLSADTAAANSSAIVFVQPDKYPADWVYRPARIEIIPG